MPEAYAVTAATTVMMAACCVRLVRRNLPALSYLRPSLRLLCTAAKQKSNSSSLEEGVQPSEQKSEPPAPDKVLLEEKGRLEEQLKETVSSE
ncbi:GrpE protein-like protein 1, mitochondrial [Heterocephalus glaber]|uniref:GrpE protein-like protein 1, mitochondrial n=1 Tax=Heterocephalus glaber TaxID=10181 RepID=G5B300_HETGA|nr:GrpE protein-like protein 1, mitochondrial [Heterocephalus glaber]